MQHRLAGQIADAKIDFPKTCIFRFDRPYKMDNRYRRHMAVTLTHTDRFARGLRFVVGKKKVKKSTETQTCFLPCM